MKLNKLGNLLHNSYYNLLLKKKKKIITDITMDSSIALQIFSFQPTTSVLLT